jgi:hypothetical protein
MGKKKGALFVLLWKPGGKQQHGRPSRGWDDNITIYFKETG